MSDPHWHHNVIPYWHVGIGVFWLFVAIFIIFIIYRITNSSKGD